MEVELGDDERPRERIAPRRRDGENAWQRDCTRGAEDGARHGRDLAYLVHRECVVWVRPKMEVVSRSSNCEHRLSWDCMSTWPELTLVSASTGTAKRKFRKMLECDRTHPFRKKRHGVGPCEKRPVGCSPKVWENFVEQKSRRAAKRHPGLGASDRLSCSARPRPSSHVHPLRHLRKNTHTTP